MRRIITVLIAFIPWSGCMGRVGSEFAEAYHLRNAIVEEFGVEDTKVGIQNFTCVGVSFVNSRFNNEPEATQEEVRKRTLELISSSYPPGSMIDKAWISFVVRERRFLVLSYTNSLNTHFYERSGDGTWRKVYPKSVKSE